MKIAVITSLYKPFARGGAEVIAEKVILELKARGHEVFVISAGEKDELEKIDNIDVYRVDPGNIFSYIDIQNQPIWKRAIWHVIDQNSKQGSKKVAQIIEERKPDLILSHSLKGLGYQIPNMIQKMGIPYVHTLHDIQLSIPSGLIIKGHEKDFLVNNPYNWFFEMRSKKLFSYCDKIVAPSQWLIEFYLKRGFFKKNTPIVLRNPVEGSRPYVEKEFNNTYVYVGQIEDHKGITYLIRAFAELQKAHPEVRLKIVGSGSLEEVLKEHYKDESWLEFAGYIPYSELGNKVFDGVSYAILPSLCYENSPNLIIEGFMNSTPVIVADVGGSAELVRDGANGFVFECANDESLLEVLERSIADSNRYNELGQKAHASVASLGIGSYLEKLFKIAGIK